MSIDSRVIPLSRFTNFSCINTTVGPTISLLCCSCKPLSDIAYISWQFVDLPNSPATAVAFQFNLTAINPTRNKIKSFVSATLRNVSNQQGPFTYRGILPNMFKFILFPVMYRNLHDLKPIQSLFHEFVPGSYFGETSQLQASVGNPKAGLINNTLSLNFLSSYIIEIENQNTFRPVSFLADLGGLYCISTRIFFYLLIQHLAGLNLMMMSTSLEGKHVKNCEIKPATQICQQHSLIDSADVPPVPPLGTTKP